MSHQPLKASAWWNYKIPPLLAVAYYALGSAGNPPPLSSVWMELGAYIVAVTAIAAFGHVFLDAFDVEEDRLLGKQNLWASRGVPERSVLLIALIVVSVLPWMILPAPPSVLILLALQFIAFALYAVPPVRLKERGMPGVVTDAMYAHVLPSLWTWIPFAVLSHNLAATWFPLPLAAWAGAVGIRHLLQHQVAQLEADRRANVATYAVRRGQEQTLSVIVRPVLVFEIAAFAILLVIIGQEFWLVPLGFIGFAVLRLSRMTGSGRARVDDAGLVSGVGTMIMTRFYERWMPLLILAGLVLLESSYVVMLLLHLLVFGRGVLELFRDDLPAMVSALRSRRAGGKPVSRGNT